MKEDYANHMLKESEEVRQLVKKSIVVCQDHNDKIYEIQSGIEDAKDSWKQSITKLNEAIK